jgi:hypothetical protein
MKRLCGMLCLAVMMVAPALLASMSVTLIDNTAQYSYGNGGEFRAVGNADLDAVVNWGAYSALTKGTVTGPTAGDWGYNTSMNGKAFFQTFCIEDNEQFTPGVSYNVGISQNAMYGDQPPTGDPISIGTAWLYRQFAAGSLAGYNYNYGAGRQSAASAGALQQAIWWLEGEGGTKNAFVIAAETALGLNDTTIKSSANGAYGVYAMNLGTAGWVQDQLVIVVPEPTTVVAGALLLLPFGASTLRILRKNRAIKDQ